MAPAWPRGGYRLAELPPLIITCAITGEHQKAENPTLPVTLEEQVEATAAAMDAGAAIIHIHGRDPADPTKPARLPGHYRRVADAIRARRPDAIVDVTQATSPLEGVTDLAGALHRYTDITLEAGPDIMSLNVGPMTFRGGGGRPSSVMATTFDDTARVAERLRGAGIKPQVFLYHPGHIDVLEFLIERDLLEPPVWVQLVFGQQSGIAPAAENVLSMVRQLPPGTMYQLCALESRSIEVALLAVTLGGHVRTGMEDSLVYRPGEPVSGNDQLVSRIVRIAKDVGRRVASPAEARQMLGLPTHREVT